MVVEKLESPSLSGKSLVEEEFAYTTKMVNANLSNFSAWHNRSQLIPRLLDERNASDEARREFLDEGIFDTIKCTLAADTLQNLIRCVMLFGLMLVTNPSGSIINFSWLPYWIVLYPSYQTSPRSNVSTTPTPK